MTEKLGFKARKTNEVMYRFKSKEKRKKMN